jgi:hypothetical protein
MQSVLTGFTFLLGKLDLSDTDDDQLSSEAHYHAVMSVGLSSVCVWKLSLLTLAIPRIFPMNLRACLWIWSMLIQNLLPTYGLFCSLRVIRNALEASALLSKSPYMEESG